MDLSKLSTEDLKALQAGDLSRVSTAGLQMMQSEAQANGGRSAVDAQPAPAPVLGSRARAQAQADGLLTKAAANILPGLVRGAGSIGATLLAPVDMAADALKGRGLSLEGNRERRAGMDGGLQALGADPTDPGYKLGKVGGEVTGTLGVGPALAAGAKALPVLGNAPNLLQAMRTAGFNAGTTTGATNALTRVAGGAATGGAAAGLVDPSSAGTGAMLGGALPAGAQLAGKVGKVVGNAVRSANPPPAAVLADALGITPAEAQALAARLQGAPTELVPGSQLTMAQALQLQGAGSPGLALLERTVAGGPGGDVLLKRYADQAQARMAALQQQGAQTYQGAAREEATRQGDKIGAVLRTQAADDQAATRAAWERLYGQAAQEDVRLLLPLEQMEGAMGPLGPGSVGVGKDARAVLRTANEVGTVDLGAPLKPITDAASARPPTLAQAVRRAGGLSVQSSDGFAGEVRALSGDLKNLVRTGGGGENLGRMAQRMHEAGYLPDADAKTLLAALRDDATGSPVYSQYNQPERQWAAQRDAAMGEPSQETRAAAPVPFDTFQRLRRDSGALGAKAAEDTARGAEARVLRDFEAALAARMDDAAAGNLRADERMTAEFADAYKRARGMTRADKERYEGGNAIEAILRRPVGQDYRLTGDEIFNKLWHGGAGLAGDVSTLKSVLSQPNYEPTMDALRQGILTDAASRTTASGALGAGLPRYVETRMPGLQEALTTEQLSVLQSVAKDIRNAEAAGAVQGLRGSDTQAKITRALDAGLIDGPMARALTRVLTVRGIGMEPLRAKLAELAKQSKGKAMAELLADPQAGANALTSAAGAAPTTNPILRILQDPRLRQAGYRAVPAIGADQ